MRVLVPGVVYRKPPSGSVRMTSIGCSGVLSLRASSWISALAIAVAGRVGEPAGDVRRRAEPYVTDRPQNGDPAAHSVALAAAADRLAHGAPLLDPGRQRGRHAQRQRDEHELPVGSPVGGPLVAGLVGRACPQPIGAGGQRRVVDTGQQAVALPFGGQRLPAPGSRRADLDRPAGHAGHPIGHVHGHQGGIFGGWRLECELGRLGVVAQRDRDGGVVLFFVAGRIASPERERELAGCRHRDAELRHVGPVLLAGAARLAVRGAQPRRRGDDRCAVELRRVRPGDHEAGLAAPSLSARQRHVHARRRRIVNPRRQHTRVRDIARRVLCLHDQGLRTFG